MKTERRIKERRGLNRRSRSFAAGALAFVLFEMALAQADAFGGDFDEFVVFDEFHAVFQRQLDGGRDFDGVFLAADAEFVSCLVRVALTTMSLSRL